MQKQDGKGSADTGRRRRWPRRLGIACAVVAAVVLVGVGAFLVYASDYYHADESVQPYLEPSGQVPVTEGDGYLAFGNADARTGFVFYPGAKVEYTAYAPVMHLLAEEGYLCIIAEMPFNLALFGIDSAQSIMGAYPAVEHWWVGGHSLGGSMAAAFASGNAERLEGLVLMASYPANDLSGTRLDVGSIYGSNDAVVNHDKLVEARSLMPQSYTEEVVEGGNHAQFGDYGDQAGDGVADITPQQQWQDAADFAAGLFASAEQAA